MKRPILDRVASTLFNLEQSRVEASSEVDEKGRMGEPMEWSESSSMANQLSQIMSSDLGYTFKQFVADIVAGEYDEEVTRNIISDFVSGTATTTTRNTNPIMNMFQKTDPTRVAMFSFTTCPFCRKAKDTLDELGINYSALELDELEGNQGNELRASLGKLTKRTSVPSIFINGKPIGGLNDGMPGLIPLIESGELDVMLGR